MTRRGWTVYALGIALAAALPIASAALRPDSPERCARDGVTLPESFGARVIDADGTSRRFCSVACVQAWLARPGAGFRSILVRDEATGAEVDARTASFVRSRIVTSIATGERLHAFGSAEDAMAHVAAFGGRLLTGSERPFGSAE